MGKKLHRTPPDVKADIIRRIKEEGITVAQAAKDHGIHETTIYNWIGVSCLSWKWRTRSSVKIAERTYEKRAQALHSSREGGHSTTPSFRQGPGFRPV